MWPPALGDQVYRKIILFDTHVRQLDQTGLESVLANEIGHYKKSPHHKNNRLGSSRFTAIFIPRRGNGEAGLVVARLQLRPRGHRARVAAGWLAW